MRPGHRSEGQDEVGAVANGFGETIGAADREGEFRRTPIAPGGDPLGQCAARPLGAALVEGDERDTRRQRAEDQFALAGFEWPGREKRLSSTSTIAGSGTILAA